MSVCFIPPYTPLLYNKTGVYRGIHFFLFLLLNIYCGYSLERLNEAVLTCTHNICFEQKYENCQNNSTENCHFKALKNRCMLHGRVFVM